MTPNLCFSYLQHPLIEPLHEFYAVFSLSHPDIPTFLCSLPNLKDLTVTDFAGMNSNDNIAFQPATLPPLAGTLTVVRYARLERLVTQWLGLPNSIHFRKFKFLWETGPHVRWVMPLVEACSDTLEHIDLEPQVGSKSYQSSSSAVRLRLIQTLQNQPMRSRPQSTSPRRQS